MALGHVSENALYAVFTVTAVFDIVIVVLK